ncbi:MAG: hypothetical protein SPI35_01440 [Porphyromonas sp.]|nr:hypothetical protein [Porphyromonas sp.]
MKKTIMYLLVTVLMLNSCNHKKPNNTRTQQGELMTITVSMPNDLKVAYDDEKVGQGALTWEDGDQILAVGKKDGKCIGAEKFTLSSGEGTRAATFIGREIPDATSYDIYYGNVEFKDGKVKVSMDGQKQSGDNSTAHLKKSIYLFGSVWRKEAERWVCSLEMKSAIMKLELSNLPTDIGTLQKIEWGITTVPSGENNGCYFQFLELENIPLSTNKLTAYVSFLPEEVKKAANGEAPQFSVELTGDRGKRFLRIPIKEVKEYQAGKRYTAKISKSEEEWWDSNIPI